MYQPNTIALALMMSLTTLGACVAPDDAADDTPSEATSAQALTDVPGAFLLKNAATGQCLTQTGTALSLTPCITVPTRAVPRTGVGQVFFATSPVLRAGYVGVSVTNLYSRQCLLAGASGAGACATAGSFVELVRDLRALTATGPSSSCYTASGATVVLAPCDGSAAQTWVQPLVVRTP